MKREAIVQILNEYAVDLFAHGLRYGYETNTPLLEKIADEIVSLPPAGGAEEILCERDDAEDFLQTKDIWNHPRISDRTDKESYEVADLMAEFAQKFATLHAQRLADKMGEERLREELIKYDKHYWGHHGDSKKEVDAYLEYRKNLKSRDSHG